uniref:Uncharacterized protein n=1 Tax=Timema poppense TaxID=170557 RepID=A0A7R9GVD0_TIMPO|nr:unnamed protein product [Timema poppensis]
MNMCSERVEQKEGVGGGCSRIIARAYEHCSHIQIQSIEDLECAWPRAQIDVHLSLVHLEEGSGSKLLRQKASMARLHSRPDPSEVMIQDDFDSWIRAKQLLRPDYQVELTDEELQEEITRVLTTMNPQLPKNIVEFNFKEGAFVSVVQSSHSVVLLDVEGTALHKESEEAKQQVMAEGGVVSVRKTSQESETAEGPIAEEVGVADKEKDGGEGEAAEAETQAEEAEDDEAGRHDSAGDVQTLSAGPKKLTNQFNFCERATLTYNNPFRDLGTQTIPPPRATFTEQVMQFTIYDAYQEDFDAQQREKEKEKKDKVVLTKKDEVKKKDDKGGNVTSRMLLAMKTIERMINQNSYDEIAQDSYLDSKHMDKDYRYWEDPSDEYREDEGTLLPLWKFVYEKTKKNNVTDITWNPHYYDMFAVTFGSFDFMKQHPEGAVCLFTLKNPSFPEYICTTDSGVVCVDIHPKYPYLMVIGKYDGNVAVYDVHLPTREPQYESNSVSNKHGGIVWEVRWGPDMPDGEINFFSVSGDGHVYNWILMQNELSQTVVIPLFLSSEPIPGPDGTLISLTGCGSAIAFHPLDPQIFLVGIEEGYIYKCSTAYSSMYLATYKAHHMPVSRIDYNSFYPDIFVSCSTDWRIKIWEDKRRGCTTSLKLSPNLRKKVRPPKKGPPIEPRQLEIMKLEKLLALVREPPVLTKPPDLPITWEERVRNDCVREELGVKEGINGGKVKVTKTQILQPYEKNGKHKNTKCIHGKRCRRQETSCTTQNEVDEPDKERC